MSILLYPVMKSEGHYAQHKCLYRVYARYATHALFMGQNLSRAILDVKPGHRIYNV